MGILVRPWWEHGRFVWLRIAADPEMGQEASPRGGNVGLVSPVGSKHHTDVRKGVCPARVPDAIQRNVAAHEVDEQRDDRPLHSHQQLGALRGLRNLRHDVVELLYGIDEPILACDKKEHESEGVQVHRCSLARGSTHQLLRQTTWQAVHPHTHVHSNRQCNTIAVVSRVRSSVGAMLGRASTRCQVQCARVTITPAYAHPDSQKWL